MFQSSALWAHASSLPPAVVRRARSTRPAPALTAQQPSLRSDTWVARGAPLLVHDRLLDTWESDLIALRNALNPPKVRMRGPRP